MVDRIGEKPRILSKVNQPNFRSETADYIIADFNLLYLGLSEWMAGWIIYASHSLISGEGASRGVGRGDLQFL